MSKFKFNGIWPLKLLSNLIQVMNGSNQPLSVGISLQKSNFIGRVVDELVNRFYRDFSSSSLLKSESSQLCAVLGKFKYFVKLVWHVVCIRFITSFSLFAWQISRFVPTKLVGEEKRFADAICHRGVNIPSLMLHWGPSHRCWIMWNGILSRLVCKFWLSSEKCVC